MSIDLDIHLVRDDFALGIKANLTSGITGLFGPSGSGKTSLLHCIAGLIKPDKGKIVLDETVLFDDSANVNMPIKSRRVGLVFQEHMLFPHLSVKGNLRYGQKSGSKDKKKQEMFDIAELLEIAHLLNRNVTTLSGGQQQRVALGRAILSSPRLLLLDEPFSGLDHGLKKQLIPYMKRLYEKTQVPMILVSHSPEEMAELTEELLFIEDGKLVGQAEFDSVHQDRMLGRFCNCHGPEGFKKARNLLIRNHGMQFKINDKNKVI